MTKERNSLSLRQKIGQLFFIGIPGPEIDAETHELLDEISPGGICLFARNIREPEQTRTLLDNVRELLPFEPLLSVDQEGGLVDRLRRITTPMPAASKLRDEEDARELAAIIGEALSTLGFNMDFAPVVDVIDDRRSKFTNGLFSREFGRSADEVVALAGAFLQKLQAAGCIGCLKHFPGLGASTVDSHEELPLVDIDESEFDRIDLHPYRALLASGGVHAVMVAHAAYPGLKLQEKDKSGKLLPASLSKSFITTLLRSQFEFDGLVITDDLEMGAIIKNYGVGEACKMAIQAGADMLAICADPARIREGYRAVVTAAEAGKVTDGRVDRSLARIAETRNLLHAPKPFSAEKLAQLSERTHALIQRLA
jgi:beta-N-acetylhexosaminidase